MSSDNNKRIAKNTLMLYFRMLFSMGVSLYTSRIVLNTLGVEDFGIYNVIGGFVSMFAVLSGSLSTAISRYITFELGKNNLDRLKGVFTTGITIQLGMAVIVLVVGEIIGIWFLNHKMTLPVERIYAANWVLHFCIFSFCVNLLTVPFNAVIIAHERMEAYAYLSIFEVSLKLFLVYLLAISPIDKLISYASLLLCVNVILCIIYGLYCKKKFDECRFQLSCDKYLLKEMSSFAGWNFFGSTAYVFNSQGVNMLMNVFFGVTVNAARGVATQVDAAVRQFINSFTTAVNPQITKSYASGDFDYMHMLICRSSKFSAFLMLFFAIPIIIESQEILTLWLGIVPEYSSIFLQLTIINTFFDCVFSNALYTSMMATGRIKKYQIVITLCGFVVFPITWLFFKVGFPPQTAYIVYGLVYFILIFVRLYLLKDLIKLQPLVFINKVILPFIPVIIASFILPLVVVYYMEDGLVRLLIVCVTSAVSTALIEYSLGLTGSERAFIKRKLIDIVKTKINK